MYVYQLENNTLVFNEIIIFSLYLDSYVCVCMKKEGEGDKEKKRKSYLIFLF